MIQFHPLSSLPLYKMKKSLLFLLFFFCEIYKKEEVKTLNHINRESIGCLSIITLTISRTILNPVVNHMVYPFRHAYNSLFYFPLTVWAIFHNQELSILYHMVILGAHQFWPSNSYRIFHFFRFPKVSGLNNLKYSLRLIEIRIFQFIEYVVDWCDISQSFAVF